VADEVSPLPPPPPPRSPAKASTGQGHKPFAGQAGRTDGPSPELLVERALAEVGRQGGRHNGALWLACPLRDNGIPEPDARQAMRSYVAHAPAADHPYPEDDALRALADAYGTAPRQPWRKHKPSSNGHTPHPNGRASESVVSAPSSRVRTR